MNEEENSKYGFILGLSVLANIFQVGDFAMNMTQLSNDALMKELLKQDEVLQHQNNMMQEQTNKYLKQILKNQEKIINLLEGK